MTIKDVLAATGREALRAMGLHPSMHSPHEGYAVIIEEVAELLECIRRDEGDGPDAGVEAIQIAAMTIRYAMDVCGSPDMKLLLTELGRDAQSHAPLRSPHEGYGWFVYHLSPLFADVRRDRGRDDPARVAAIWVGATAVRYALDVAAPS